MSTDTYWFQICQDILVQILAQLDTPCYTTLVFDVSRDAQTVHDSMSLAM